jgi:ABC-type uncharacterized transport system permease subunit
MDTSSIMHFIALVTLALYLLMIVKVGRCVLREGVSYQPPASIYLVDRIARCFLLTLVFMTFFEESGRGGAILWVAGALEVTTWLIGWTNVILRFFVCISVSFLILLSSLLAHLPSMLFYNTGTLFLVSHVVPAILAEAFLLLTGCGGIVYLIQTYLLKKRSMDVLGSKLPSLTALENWMVWFSRGGLVLMTIGMVIGYVGLHGRSESLFFWVLSSWSTAGAFCGWFLLLMIVLGRQFFFRKSMRTQALVAALTIPIFVLVTFWARWFSAVNHFDPTSQIVEEDRKP